MTMTPQEARARLESADRSMHMMRLVHPAERQRVDVLAGVTAAVDELIRLLKDALA